MTDASATTAALTVEGIVKDFARRGGHRGETHRAVDDVSLQLARGEILGLAGGSGSGKTTLARCIIRLAEPDAGRVLLGDTDVLAARGKELRQVRRRIQMVFQDPYASLNPRLTVGSALLEVGRVHRLLGDRGPDAFVGELLDRVHLARSIAMRHPRALSGGQRQRVAIARALATGPDVLIADEAVSALDVSVQAQLLRLFVDLRDELGVSILFVTHQLAVLAEVADRVAVMQTGRIVETGVTRDVFRDPQHAYTRALLAAHPRADPRLRIDPGEPVI
jgi:ABC-type glutathione transport system ATPase component